MVPASSFNISANLHFQSEDGTIQFVSTAESSFELRFSDWNIFFKVLVTYGPRLKSHPILDILDSVDVLIQDQMIIRVRQAKVKVASLLDGLKILFQLVKYWVKPDSSN